MIKSDFGKVEVSGIRLVIEAELASLIHGIYTEKVLTREEIEECIKDGFKTEEQIIQEGQMLRKDVENELDKKTEELINKILD